MLDYESSIGIENSANITFTAPTNGVMFFSVLGGNTYAVTSLKVNGVGLPITPKVSSGEYRCMYYVPVSKGDVFNISGAINTFYSRLFIPLKGAK